MIVCSCNVLTRQQILDAAASETAHARRTPAQTYRCLGCAPDCGRCLVTVRAILAEARLAHCAPDCADCPGHRQPGSAGREKAARLVTAAE